MSKRSIVAALIFAAQIATLVGVAPEARAFTLSGYELPWNAGEAHRIGGSWYGQGRHSGRDQYALDWNLRYDTVLAIQRGVVVARQTGVPDPGWSSCGHTGGYGNFVIIDHLDGVRSLYAHLKSVSVRVGQGITQGTKLGVSGNTGSSCGPHLHFRLTYNRRARRPAPMGTYRSFPNNHTRLYVSRNHLNGVAPPPLPTPAPTPNATPPVTPAPLPSGDGEPRLQIGHPLGVTAPSFTAGELATFLYTVGNVGSARQDLGTFAVRMRAQNGSMETLPCPGSPTSLRAGGRFRCIITTRIERAGAYQASADWSDRAQRWHPWSLGEPVRFDLSEPRLDLVVAPTVTGDPAVQADAALRFTYAVENPSDANIAIHLLYLRLRGPRNERYALPCEDGTDITLAPHQQFACTASGTLHTAQNYEYSPAWIDARGNKHTDVGDRRTLTLGPASLPDQLIHVRVAGPGTLHAEPGNFECADVCARSYTAGTVLLFTARATEGGRFVGWVGACAGTGTCAVTADRERWVKAEFSTAYVSV